MVYVGAQACAPGAEPGVTINNIDNYQLFLKALWFKLILAHELIHTYADISWHAQCNIYVATHRETFHFAIKKTFYFHRY